MTDQPDDDLLLGTVRFRAFNTSGPEPLIIEATCMACGKVLDLVSYTPVETKEELEQQIERASIRAIQKAALAAAHVCYHN